MSKGEEEIAKVLKENKIKFQREYTFDDLHSTKGGLLRYDFAIFNEKGELEYLCEFDGQQHMQQTEYFQQHRADFLRTQGHDRQKNSYALAHNIPLYRIPYWELGSIKTIEDIKKENHLVKSKYHNDDLIIPEN